MDHKPLSRTTRRLYRGIEGSFRAWCAEQGIRFPPSHEVVAAYLRHCARTRGASSVAQHRSAIAHLYRSIGRPLDTRVPAIQRVVVRARRAVR
jgi:hypothetical protein